MPCFGCLKKPSSLEDLLKHRKIRDLKVKTPRSKVNMRSVIKCNSPVLFIVGPPGVGKKKQAQMIAKKFGYVHFDVPYLVKVEATQNTPRGRHVKWILMKSRNFPEFLHLDLLKEAMAQAVNSGIRPPAWLVTGFPCLLEEALRFEEEVGRVALLVHLFGEIRLLLKTIKLNYKTRGMKIPSRLREHLIMFGEHLMPLLAAYDDRVEHVELVEDENLVFQELFSVVVHFDERKPSNNRPTTATQKVVDRLKLLRSSFDGPYQQNTSQELYLYSPYGPRSLILKSRKITPVVSQHLSDDQSISDEQTATPTLARLGLLRPPSRPSMNEEELEMTIKPPSVTRMEGPSDTKSSDNEIIITPILKRSSPSSETSHTKPKTKSKLSVVKKVSKPIIKRVNLPS